jgi:uncharacterized protein YbjQ (UPF0145 family)
MTISTGLSGNEIYCLALKGYRPGNIVVGNSVHALGLIGSIGSGFRAMVGGEMTQVTSLIEQGRETAYQRMEAEAKRMGATGITGVSSELVLHGTNIEFLSIGSCVHSKDASKTSNFSTSDDGQQLFAQIDAGFQPICFVLGNVAYSMGLGRGLKGGLKTFVRGEIREYSDIFNHTRHLALQRISTHAAQYKANAVLGISTTILPFGGINEMLMVGTASRYNNLPSELQNSILTSDMTNIEMWSMMKLGFMPMKLLLGTSVYSLGFIGGLSSFLKSFVRGEINELTRMIYAARENALDIINQEAKAIGADDVLGIKTYVYQLSNGLVEFLAIGTAVKKIPNVKTSVDELPIQVVIKDTDTFYDAVNPVNKSVNINTGQKPINNKSFFVGIIVFLIFFFIYLIPIIKGFL